MGSRPTSMYAQPQQTYVQPGQPQPVPYGQPAHYTQVQTQVHVQPAPQPVYTQPAPQPMKFRVVFPQGVAWRSAPNYNAKITNVQGPVVNTELSGPVVQGQDGLQYLQVGSQFLPLMTPQGQPLLQQQMPMMQQQMNQDIRRVQQGYAQPGYAQPGYPPQQTVVYHGGKMKKMKGHKKAKGYKMKLF